MIDGEPAALLYPCIQVLFEDSDSLLTMLLLSQAAYSLCPYPRKTKTGWMMQERSYETFRALQQKNAFPSYLSPSTRCGMPDLHTYHYFSYQSPAVRPSTGSHSAYCARLAESLVPKNPQLQSAAGRRIGHSRLSRSTHNSRERTSISFGVVVGSLSSVSLRTSYRVNRKRRSQILDFQNLNLLL